MKSKYLQFFFILAGIINITCEMQNDSENNVGTQSDRVVISRESDIKALCVNNLFPKKSVLIDGSCGWRPCYGDPEISIVALQGTYLWAAYNPYWDEDLLFKACNGTIPEYLPEIEGFTKIEDIHYPKMKWNFMWAHYYVVKRKINDGNWQIIYTYTVPNQGMSNPPDTSFTDTTIRLTTFEGTVCYKVYGRVWTVESPSASMLYWGEFPQIESLGD